MQDKASEGFSFQLERNLSTSTHVRPHIEFSHFPQISRFISNKPPAFLVHTTGERIENDLIFVNPIEQSLLRWSSKRSRNFVRQLHQQQGILGEKNYLVLFKQEQDEISRFGWYWMLRGRKATRGVEVAIEDVYAREREMPEGNQSAICLPTEGPYRIQIVGSSSTGCAKTNL